MTTTERQSREVIQRLKGFRELQRKDTDETGYIALVYSCTREQADTMILDAYKFFCNAPLTHGD